MSLFLICCLGWSWLFFQGASIFQFPGFRHQCSDFGAVKTQSRRGLREAWPKFGQVGHPYHQHSLAFLGLWQPHSNLCLHLHVALLPLCVCLYLFSSKDISHIGLRAHPSSTASLTYILITSTKAMFPSKVTFTGTGNLDHVFWGTWLPPCQFSTFVLIHRHQRLPMKHEGFL